MNLLNMKNHLLLTFFLVATYWQQSKSDDILGNVDNKKNDQSKVIGQFSNNFAVNNVGVARRGNVENVLQYNEFVGKVGFFDEKRGNFEKNGYEFERDAGNSDIHGEIKRPCQVYDTFCIRKFFAEHSHCKISGRRLPDPLYRAQSSVNFGSANITQTQVNVDFGGLNNARISEFYVNKVTDNLVIAITFDGATKYSNNTYYKFYLRGREPVVTRDFGGIRYGVLTVTVVIPHLNDLRLDRSEIYTYGDTDIYQFVLGPRLAETTDPEVLSMYARFYTNMLTEYQEEISHTGDFIAGNYIQYNICDFGLKVL